MSQFRFGGRAAADWNTQRIRKDCSIFPAGNLKKVFGHDCVFGSAGSNDIAREGFTLVRANFESCVGFQADSDHVSSCRHKPARVLVDRVRFVWEVGPGQEGSRKIDHGYVRSVIGGFSIAPWCGSGVRKPMWLAERGMT